MKTNEPELATLLKEIEVVHVRFDDLADELQRLRQDIASQRTDHNWGLLHIFHKLGIKVSKARAVGVTEELYEQAKQAVIEAGHCSTSQLQRRFNIGYARAARLVDMLEERGVVGTADGVKPRELLIS